MIDRIGRVKNDTDKKLNDIIDAVNCILNMRGSNGIQTRVLPNSISIIGTGTTGEGGGTTLRNAFASDDAGAGTTISCFLDTDGTGEVITVNCEIVGGSALNSAIPRLEDGDRLTVWNDAGTWRCTTIFQATTDC